MMGLGSERVINDPWDKRSTYFVPFYCRPLPSSPYLRTTCCRSPDVIYTCRSASSIFRFMPYIWSEFSCPLSSAFFPPLFLCRCGPFLLVWILWSSRYPLSLMIDLSVSTTLRPLKTWYSAHRWPPFCLHVLAATWVSSMFNWVRSVDLPRRSPPWLCEWPVSSIGLQIWLRICKLQYPPFV